MGALNYNPELQVTLDDLLLAHPGVTTGVVFGLPCYKVHGVVFATLCGEGVGIKLPETRVKELLEQPGFVPFRPFGRNRGKEFVQIQHEYPKDYQLDHALFEESMRYVLSPATGQRGRARPIPVQEACEEEQCFRSIAALLARENSAITSGKMMSSPALQYQGKVFAFYYDKQMVFRLGRAFQPEAFSIRQYQVLAPFKTKPPMADWFEIPFAEQHLWEDLARYALQRLVDRRAK
jgi:hypothetical protein